MTHVGTEQIEDYITAILKASPQIGVGTIVYKLKVRHDTRITVDTARKILNRMIQFGDVRANMTDGQIAYYLPKGA